MVYSAKAGTVRNVESDVNKYRRTAKREASRGGGSIQHKTICGRQICAPEEYSSLCGLSEGVRYRNH